MQVPRPASDAGPPASRSRRAGGDRAAGLQRCSGCRLLIAVVLPPSLDPADPKTKERYGL
jgi:hypothetical protein